MPDIFDNHADSYSEDIDQILGKYGANHDFFTQHKAWLIENLLRSRGLEIEKLKIVDVGCGVGKIHQYLDGKFAKIAGADVSKTSLDVAKETYKNIDYRWYDGHKLPFDDNVFDLSLAICVFHHVPPEQWVELAREMLRVLRPDGISLIIEHNPYNPLTQRIVSTCDLDKDAILLRPSKLRSIFEAAGGKNIKSRTILSVPPKSKLLKKIDGALGILPLGAQYYLISDKQL